MNLRGSPDDILAALIQQYPELSAALMRARARVPVYKREIAHYQAAALYALARPYNRLGARILEIGTAWGYSAAVLAEACPLAQIATLNPQEQEVNMARVHLKDYPNVTVLTLKSWDFLKTLNREQFDLIFVDGDHKRVRADLPFWNTLTSNGLFLFHDYSPKGAHEGKGGKLRECPPVFDTLNSFARQLDKPAPDVTVIDDGGVGMAGFYASKERPVNKHTYQLTSCFDHSALGYSQLEAMYAIAQQFKDTPGDMVEAGCTNGGSLMALALGARRDTKPLKRTHWALDTFNGIPQPDRQRDGDKAYTKWLGAQKDGGWHVGSPDKVKELAAALKIPSVKIIPGLFADTLSQVTTSQIVILHIDATLYQSTQQALNTLYDRVADGGAVIISAYHHWQGIHAAVNEFLAARALQPLTFVLNGSSIWWRK